MSKELWLEEWQRIYDQAIEDGLTEKAAESLADEDAYDAMRDRLADMADQARQRRKDGM